MAKSRDLKSTTSLKPWMRIGLTSFAVGGAALFAASPAQAQQACISLPLLGTINCTDGAGGIDLDILDGPVIADLDDDIALTDTLSLATTLTGDIIVNTLGDASISSPDGPGLDISAAEGLTARITNITTAGDGAIGAALTAVDEVIFTADGLVTTVGDLADGVAIEGSTVDAAIGSLTTAGEDSDGILIGALGAAELDVGTLLTEGGLSDGINMLAGGPVSANVGSLVTLGEDSNGIDIVSTDGPILLDADAVDVNGGLSDAVVLSSADDINVNVRALSTSGMEGVALNLSTVPAACVLLGNQGCEVTAASDSITTEGFGGIGVLTRVVGDTNIDMGVLRTGGDEAAGLDLGVNDLDACVLVGVGGCNTAFTVEELTTAGARAPGALVSAAGTIVADVGVLRTQGDEAVGLDLTTDPTACATLGAGACDTSFSVGELTTGGAGATGILARITGATTGDVGILRTQGEDAAGIDIATDPVACALIGAGACDVGLTAGEVTTEGDGAAAVLIDALGDVTTDLGLLRTGGDNATALGILLDPVACLAVGPGACAVQAAVDDVETGGDDSPGVDVESPGPIDVDVGDVDTGGDGSPGVDVDGGEGPIDVDTGDIDTGGEGSPGVEVDGTGPISVTTGDVDTDGDGSPGIDVDGDDGPVDVSFEDVTTAGDGSPGVIISGEGAIDVDGGTVTTAGAGSDGINVDGGDGPVTIDVDAITTAGADSDGIDVVAEDGDITILAGPVTVTGAGSDGISAVAAGCGDVSITARDDIRSAQGAAIVGASACTVAVTTLPGAAVSGATAGIGVTSGLGSTITIGDAVAASAGPAIDADGGPATVTIQPTGSVNGFVDLTDSADTLSNGGTFTATADSNFGAGADSFLNSGRLQSNGLRVMAGLETFSNTGTVSMVDGAADDTLALPGGYAGGTGATLGIDVAGTAADRLIVGGAATGTTAVALNVIGTPAANPTGTVIVDAASQTPGAFVIAGPASRGFVDYSLGTTGGDTLLFATPNGRAAEPAMFNQFGQTFWYQSADAFTQSAAARRNDLASRDGSFHPWMQVYGGDEEAGEGRSIDVFGTATDTDLEYDYEYKGVQAGFDFGGGVTTFGVTGGYQLAEAGFNSGTSNELSGYNVGAYVLHAPESGLYAQALAKADFYDIDYDNGFAFRSGIDGKSYGVEGEAGLRTGLGGMSMDIGAGLAWVRTDIDGFVLEGSEFAFDKSTSLRGRAGVRIASTSAGVAPFLDAKLFHEFKGDADTRFLSGGFTLPVSDPGRGTWGRIEAGITGNMGTAGGFLSGWGTIGDVKGFGVRAGIRF